MHGGGDSACLSARMAGGFVNKVELLSASRMSNHVCLFVRAGQANHHLWRRGVQKGGPELGRAKLELGGWLQLRTAVVNQRVHADAHEMNQIN